MHQQQQTTTKKTINQNNNNKKLLPNCTNNNNQHNQHNNKQQNNRTTNNKQQQKIVAQLHQQQQQTTTTPISCWPTTEKLFQTTTTTITTGAHFLSVAPSVTSDCKRFIREGNRGLATNNSQVWPLTKTSRICGSTFFWEPNFLLAPTFSGLVKFSGIMGISIQKKRAPKVVPKMGLPIVILGSEF